MSVASLKGQTLELKQLTVNNAYQSKSKNYKAQETVINPNSMFINGYRVLTEAYISSYKDQVNESISAGDSKPIGITLENFLGDAKTVFTYSITTNGSGIYCSNISSEVAGNDTNVTFTFNNSNEADVTIGTISVIAYP